MQDASTKEQGGDTSSDGKETELVREYGAVFDKLGNRVTRTYRGTTRPPTIPTELWRLWGPKKKKQAIAEYEAEKAEAEKAEAEKAGAAQAGLAVGGYS